MRMNNPLIHLVILQQCTILEQLRIEEALLRADGRNWCLLHQKPAEAIVMGISAQPEQVIDFNKFQEKPVPLIRRFSGGGTVFIDENSVMATFICDQADMQVPCFPQPVLQWSENFYRPIFQGMDFSLRENDYVIGHKKFGGNAQYMTKHRWLHHTSFLWDYHVEKMNYLKMPPKMPQYRQQRSHSDFLCPLKEHFYSVEDLIKKISSHLEHLFTVRKVEQSELLGITALPHRKATIALS
jgi:lipoate---protein ligase